MFSEREPISQVVSRHDGIMLWVRHAATRFRDEGGGLMRYGAFFVMGAFALGYVLWKAGWLSGCLNAGEILGFDILNWAEVCLPSGE